MIVWLGLGAAWLTVVVLLWIVALLKTIIAEIQALRGEVALNSIRVQGIAQMITMIRDEYFPIKY